MNHPSPALVAQRAAQRLPRWALLLFCTAYLLPGLFGRDPWKSADISAVGYMARLADGRTSWLRPELGGVDAPGGLVPYWLGALSIDALTPWISLPMAARWPFVALLAGTLALVWYACFHLARAPAAQPVAFAFGGEAHPIDYARALADGAVLALMAQLGLLQLGHETTPELVQLFAVAWLIYGWAAIPWRRWRSRTALVLAPAVLAASGAPTTALILSAVLTLAGALVRFDHSGDSPRLSPPLAWIALGLAGAIGVGLVLDAWHLRLGTLRDALLFPKLVVWFTWPVWPMVAWTLWQWRRQVVHPHIALPAAAAGVCMSISVAMGSSDRALMLALPGLAILAAFSLPTLKRSLSAAVDWFSMLFLTGWAITFWVVYIAMQTGVPAQPARNVAKLLPGFAPVFQPWALAAALAGTLAWLALAAWRTGKHRHPLWKSLVLPAGGVALNWLLAMTLLLPPLDYARSYRVQIRALQAHLPAGTCVQIDSMPVAEMAALEVLGGWKVVAPGGAKRCDWLVLSVDRPDRTPQPDGWRFVTRKTRPSDKDDTLIVYRRTAD